MKTISDIIEAFETDANFGRACGVERNPASRAADMRRRESIPVEYWPRLIEAAAALGRDDLTSDVLVRVHADAAEAKKAAKAARATPGDAAMAPAE